MYPIVPDSWPLEGYIKDEAKGHSWICVDVDSQNKFTWWCGPCASSQKLRQANNTYRQGGDRAFKTGNLTRHQSTASHADAVCEMLGLDPITEQIAEPQGPQVHVFREVFKQFAAGSAPNDGYDLGMYGGLIGKIKAERILWLIYEATKEAHRQKLKEAKVICLMRDERGLVEHIRFRCCNALGEVTAGFLGQVHVEPSALGINQGTMDVIKIMCTKWYNVPAYLDLDVHPELDQAAYDNICRCTEAIATDSADNEIAATRDLSVTTNFLCKTPYILRDNCHSARRVLSRGFAADDVLSGVTGFLFSWSDSLGQLMHHSVHIAAMYKECVAEFPSSTTSSLFGTLRTAKHRFESQMTPLSRIVLNMDAFLEFGKRLYVSRKGTREGRVAKVFLETISFKILLLAAMMADAGAEVLVLLRSLDTEELMEPAAIMQTVEGFLDRVTWLFFNGGCMEAGTDSYTAVMLKWLESSHYFVLEGKGKAIGGGKPTQEDLDDCYKKIRSWVLLARDVIQAEFPAFDLVSSFSAFACIEKGKKITDAVRSKVKRLSQTFKRPNLMNQFIGFFEAARHELTTAGCTYHDAWMNAVMRFRDARSNLPSDCLLHVLMRLRVFAPCTSKIEQSFSVILATFGSKRMGMFKTSENMAVTVLLLRNISEPEREAILGHAQKLWVQVIGTNARTHTKRKIDHGVKKMQTSSSSSSLAGALPSEKTFKKNLHEQIVSKSAGVDHIATLTAYEPPDDAWTASHEEERKFNRKKIETRAIEANFKDLILPHEKSAALQTASQVEMDRRTKAFDDRVRKARKIIDTIRPDMSPTIGERSVFVLDECWSDDLAQALARHNCRRVREESEATVFIMHNPFASDLPNVRRVQFAASLMGAVICVPSVYTHGRSGPWVRFNCAVSVNRFFFATQAFQDQFPRLWYLLVASIAKPESNWKIIDLGKYLVTKLKYPAGHRVIAACTQEEFDLAVTSGVNNMFTPELLLKFIQQINETQSVLTS